VVCPDDGGSAISSYLMSLILSPAEFADPDEICGIGGNGGILEPWAKRPPFLQDSTIPLFRHASGVRQWGLHGRTFGMAPGC
jgi:hypothetical protein